MYNAFLQLLIAISLIPYCYQSVKIPFNCQWQDLKDLFRNAGNILRADIAQGNDGRSRGFGTVLYATPEDAKNAVGELSRKHPSIQPHVLKIVLFVIALYDGYEYQGRRLRVHFDKFAPSTSTPHPGQGLPEIHGGFQDPMHLRSPFLSRMPYPPLSMPSMPGIHMFQSPSPLPHMRAYINPYTNTSDMIMPPQMPLSITNMQDSQGLANTEIGPSVSVITQVEQPEQFTSVLTDPANNSIHRPIGLPNARASALGSLGTFGIRRPSLWISKPSLLSLINLLLYLFFKRHRSVWLVFLPSSSSDAHEPPSLEWQSAPFLNV